MQYTITVKDTVPQGGMDKFELEGEPFDGVVVFGIRNDAKIVDGKPMAQVSFFGSEVHTGCIATGFAAFLKKYPAVMPILFKELEATRQIQVLKEGEQ